MTRVYHLAAALQVLPKGKSCFASGGTGAMPRTFSAMIGLMLGVAVHEAGLGVEGMPARAQRLLAIAVCEHAVLVVSGTLAGVPLSGSLALMVGQVEQHLLLVAHVMMCTATCAPEWSLLRRGGNFGALRSDPIACEALNRVVLLQLRALHLVLNLLAMEGRMAVAHLVRVLLDSPLLRAQMLLVVHHLLLVWISLRSESILRYTVLLQFIAFILLHELRCADLMALFAGGPAGDLCFLILLVIVVVRLCILLGVFILRHDIVKILLLHHIIQNGS